MGHPKSRSVYFRTNPKNTGIGIEHFAGIQKNNAKSHISKIPRDRDPEHIAKILGILTSPGSGFSFRGMRNPDKKQPLYYYRSSQAVLSKHKSFSELLNKDFQALSLNQLKVKLYFYTLSFWNVLIKNLSFRCDSNIFKQGWQLILLISINSRLHLGEPFFLAAFFIDLTHSQMQTCFETSK